jgi:hypothetical protein
MVNRVDRLYKTLPPEFVETLLDGNVLFRNLVYFRLIEGDPRTDTLEGTHVDKPNNPVLIQPLGRPPIIGRFAYHRSAKYPQRIFCFCTSMRRRAEHAKFGGACVEILDPAEFTRRLRVGVVRQHRLRPLEAPTLVARPVTYYHVNRAAPAALDITDPGQLAFAKRAAYAEEDEFRFLFTRRGACQLVRKIVTEEYDELEELAAMPQEKVFIKIGDIRNIARRVD